MHRRMGRADTLGQLCACGRGATASRPFAAVCADHRAKSLTVQASVRPRTPRSGAPTQDRETESKGRPEAGWGHLFRVSGLSSQVPGSGVQVQVQVAGILPSVICHRFSPQLSPQRSPQLRPQFSPLSYFTPSNTVFNSASVSGRFQSRKRATSPSKDSLPGCWMASRS